MKKDVLRGVRYFCMECNGFDSGGKAIRKCESKSCPLFPFRMGADPSPKKNLLAYQLAPNDWAKMRLQQGRYDWNSMQGIEKDYRTGGVNA